MYIPDMTERFPEGMNGVDMTPSYFGEPVDYSRAYGYEPTPNKFNINIHEFLMEFKRQYTFLYEWNNRVAGYDEALKEGDEFIKNHPDFVGEFIRHRGDFISSDREVVAFMFALDNMIGE